jgi:hypothetical protein
MRSTPTSLRWAMMTSPRVTRYASHSSPLCCSFAGRVPRPSPTETRKEICCCGMARFLAGLRYTIIFSPIFGSIRVGSGRVDSVRFDWVRVSFYFIILFYVIYFLLCYVILFSYSFQVNPTQNDTRVLFETLVAGGTEISILDTMKQIHGPWAFIFWQVSFFILMTQLHVCSCVVRIQMYENYQNKTCESVHELRTFEKPCHVWELCVSECRARRNKRAIN